MSESPSMTTLPSFAQTFSSSYVRSSLPGRSSGSPELDTGASSSTAALRDHQHVQRPYALPPLQQHLQGLDVDGPVVRIHHNTGPSPVNHRASPSARTPGSKRSYDNAMDSQAKPLRSAVDSTLKSSEAKGKGRARPKPKIPADTDELDAADDEDNAEDDSHPIDPDLAVKLEPGVGAIEENISMLPHPRSRPPSPRRSSRHASPRGSRQANNSGVYSNPPRGYTFPSTLPPDDGPLSSAQNKRRRVTISGPSHNRYLSASSTPISPVVMGFTVPPESADQLKNALTLKQKQKALIEQRLATGSAGSSTANTPVEPARSSAPALRRYESSPTTNGSSTSQFRVRLSPPSSATPESPQVFDHDNSSPSILSRRRGNGHQGALPPPPKLTVRTSEIGGPDPAIRSAPPLQSSERRHYTDVDSRDHSGVAFNGQSIRRSSHVPAQSFGTNGQRPPNMVSVSHIQTWGDARPEPTPTQPNDQSGEIGSRSTRRAPIAGPRAWISHSEMVSPPQPTSSSRTSGASRSSTNVATAPISPTSFRTQSALTTPVVPTFPTQSNGNNQSCYPNAPPDAPKAAFLSLFDSFYDSLTDSRLLKQWLEEQMQKSSGLYHSLQQTSENFSQLVDDKVNASRSDTDQQIANLVRQFQASEERSAREIRELKLRIEHLEQERQERVTSPTNGLILTPTSRGQGQRHDVRPRSHSHVVSHERTRSPSISQSPGLPSISERTQSKSDSSHRDYRSFAMDVDTSSPRRD